MERLRVHQGRAVPLRYSDVDTDQIIPARWCRLTSRTGFANALFAHWREDPDFVLNDPRYSGATVLLAGPNFGIGSSREHAVWALWDYGFRVVVSASFGDIFRGNATKTGLLPLTLPSETVAQLHDTVEEQPATALTVDVVRCELRYRDVSLTFPLEEHVRWRFLEGVDDIAVTLRHGESIAAYERRRPRWLPAIEPSGA